MKDNILPFKKYERFPLSTGTVTNQGEVIEGNPVGFAFLKPRSKMFRLKIWTFPNINYFLAQDEGQNLDQYHVLALEEFQTSGGELKSNWNKVGNGQLVGNFIKIQIHLVACDIFLCLFPSEPEVKEAAIAL